jgi:mono/diheme cytochrome c family protein
MKKVLSTILSAILVVMFPCASAVAATTVEMFEIEGLISPASPKALTAELEEKLAVKVVDLNLKNTASGWPVLTVEFDSGSVSREDIAETIASIEDPAGHKYQVHVGPPISNAAFIDEEIKAMAAFGPANPDIVPMTSPVEATVESVSNGQSLFKNYCATCHGLNGGGQGPAAHGITMSPRQLWVWSSADSAADGYLYWYITNGRNEMPPWGVILSENERWDVINYIKTLKKPE